MNLSQEEMVAVVTKCKLVRMTAFGILLHAVILSSVV